MTIDKEAKGLGMQWEQAHGSAPAVQVGDTIYISGQVSHDDEGNVLGEGDMGVQMRAAYANVEKVLAQYGATIENIVDEIIFVTDMETGLATRAELKDEVYAGKPVVACTIVEIAKLAFPPLMVEIRCVARV